MSSESVDLYSGKPESYYASVKQVAIKRLVDENLGRVLDVGGGNGATSKFLVDHGRAESSRVIDPYATPAESNNVRITTESADEASTFESLKAEGECFDTIMFLDVLEHLFDPWAVLEWIKVVHKDGGRLVICMPNARFVALVVPLVLWGRFDYRAMGVMDRTHIRWFTRATLIEMVEGAGYKIDKIEAYVEPRVSLINKLTLGLFRRFFEYQYIVQASKT